MKRGGMNIANRLTVMRILLVPAFVTSLLYSSPRRPYFHAVAVSVYLLACITDGIDGYLARKLRQKTKFGSYMDPLADKLLLISGYLSLSLMPNIPEAMRVPAWVTIIVISRDVVIVAGSVIIFLITGRFKVRTLFIGKLTTVVQMAALFSALLWLSPTLSMTLYFLAAALTLFSAYFYIRSGSRELRGHA